MSEILLKAKQKISLLMELRGIREDLIKRKKLKVEYCKDTFIVKHNVAEEQKRSNQDSSLEWLRYLCWVKCR